MSRNSSNQVDGQVLQVRLEVEYSTAEFIELIKQAFDSLGTPDKVALLIDGSQTNVERTQEEYQQIIETFISLADRMICLAYVTLSDKLSKNIQHGASFAEYNGLGAVKSFRDKESAQKWIRDQLKK